MIQPIFQNKYFVSTIVLISFFLIAGCGSQGVTALPSPENIKVTDIPTRTMPLPTATREPSPTPEPSRKPGPNTIREPRVLTICMGAEPDTLFIYGGSMLAQSQILQAIYDGPIETLNFDYQPVILEKLPSLADGDALIQPVVVQAGDWVVNNTGEVVTLIEREVVRPYGCNRSDCALAWDGTALEMAQLSVDYKLIEGVKWSDGEPLTARDSVFSYEVALGCKESGMCDPFGIPSPKLHDYTASYILVDELTTRWVGLPGALDPEYRANFFHPLPELQIGHLSPDEMAEDPITRQKPMGWGPYAISDYQYGQYIKMVPNRYYFRMNEGLPRFDELIYRFVGNYDPLHNLSLIQTGRCDVLEYEASYTMQAEHMDTLLEMDADGKVQAHITTGTVWEHADFSIGHADYDDGYQPGIDRPDFFGDARTRQAIAMCMDRQKVVEDVQYGVSSILDTYLPFQHPLYNPEVSHYDFDPAEGSELLEQVGWVDHDNDPATPRVARGVPEVPEGTPLSFTYATTTSTQRQQAAQILAESLLQCGIHVNLEYLPSEEFFADAPDGALFSRRFDMAQFAWLTSADPPCDFYASDTIPGSPEILDQDGKPRFPNGWMGQNETGYHNSEYDQACWAAKEGVPGMAGYVENHYRAQEIFARDLPAIPLFLRIKFAVTRPDFCGLILDPTSNSELWNLENFDYGDGCQ